jgi:signal transduction histidine kinase
MRMSHRRRLAPRRRWLDDPRSLRDHEARRPRARVRGVASEAPARARTRGPDLLAPPRASANLREHPHEGGAQASRGRAPPLYRCLLLVDDDPRNLLALQALLAPLGHRLVRAADAMEAMQVFEEARPDLVISDLRMPRYDGIDLLGMIRTHPDRSDTPVILVTAHGEREHRLRALRAGADDFLEKPIDEALLIARVNNLLRLKQAKDDLVAQRDELQRSRRERRELNEFMVRDVRGSLSHVCIGLAGLANEVERSSEPMRETVARIEGDARQVSDMLEDLLWITRLEHLAFPLQKRDVALDEEVRRSIMRVADTANRRRIAMDAAVNRPIVVETDERLLDRVLANLIDNAMRHALEGGHVLVELTCGDEIELCVHNDGPRVPRVERDRIFGKFVRGATEPPYSGHAGLGLYFCKCAMKALDGDVELVERPGWSTSFRLRLPSRAERAPDSIAA